MRCRSLICCGCATLSREMIVSQCADTCDMPWGKMTATDFFAGVQVHQLYCHRRSVCAGDASRFSPPSFIQSRQTRPRGAEIGAPAVLHPQGHFLAWSRHRHSLGLAGISRKILSLPKPVPNLDIPVARLPTCCWLLLEASLRDGDERDCR